MSVREIPMRIHRLEYINLGKPIVLEWRYPGSKTWSRASGTLVEINSTMSRATESAQPEFKIRLKVMVDNEPVIFGEDGLGMDTCRWLTEVKM